MACAICETRRERRFCSGLGRDICAICCGTEREVTVNCPLDCEYLAAARRHDRLAPIGGGEVPNADIEISERLVREHVPLLDALASTLAGAALETGAIDADAREALAALIRTFRSLESGVYYETRPAGSFATAIYAALQNAAQHFRAEEQRRLGVTRTRDADVLGLLVFLQRMELDRNNGRARGRAFIDALRGHYDESADSGPPAERSSLILP